MFKTVTTNAIDLKKELGKAKVGTYMGKTEITTKIGPQVIWNFIDEEGIPFGVYGFTNLNRAMEALKVNSLVRLTYQGTKNVKTKFGMKDVHQVHVEVDTEGQEDEMLEEVEVGA